MKKLTLNEIQKKIDKAQDNRIKIIGEFNSEDKTHKKALVKCLNCGLVWRATPHSLERKMVGINCHHHVKFDDDTAKLHIYMMSNKKIQMIEKYKGSSEPKLMRCNICNYRWKTQPSVLFSGKFGCPNCHGKAPMTTERFRKIVKQSYGNKYLILGKITGKNYSKVLMKHNIKKCGRTFIRNPHYFLENPGCPFEIKERKAKKQIRPLKEVKKKLYYARHNEFKIIKGYKGMKRKCWIKHIGKCNRSFHSFIGPIIAHNNGCPYCYSSNGEDATRNYLEQHNFSFKEQYRIKQCKYKRPLPFDFAIFKYNKLKYLIEYQGIQHTVSKFGKKQLKLTQMRDNIKYNYCVNHNIPLIRIPYKDWHGEFSQLQSQVNEYLKNRLLI